MCKVATYLLTYLLKHGLLNHLASRHTSKNDGCRDTRAVIDVSKVIILWRVSRPLLHDFRWMSTARPSSVVNRIRQSQVAKASLVLTQGVYAMARNLACQWRRNSWWCAWGRVAMRVRWSSQCHVVAKILKRSKIISKVSWLVTTKLISAHAWHWVSRISWTVRNLRVTERERVYI